VCLCVCVMEIEYQDLRNRRIFKFIVLYCIVLYCTVLHCVVVYCIILYRIVLYCVVFISLRCIYIIALLHLIRFILI
jgi:hypothetical protein